MNTGSIRPSTVDGIKKLAKKIKRERNVPHTEALDLASRQAGFENFVHARREIEGRLSLFPVYLTAHWSDPRKRLQDRRWAGRELLKIRLSKPLAEVVARHQIGVARGLRGYRMEYLDHVEHLTDFTSREAAHESLVAAARALRFMEATGLRPVTTQVYARQMHLLDRMPAKDHVSEWFDPESSAWVFLNEPYANRVEEGLARRSEWIERHGLYEVHPAWEGLYLPGECLPHLVSNNPTLLTAVAKKLANLEPLPSLDHLPFEIGLNGEDFISPMREAAGKSRRPRPGPSYFDHKGSRPYGGRPGIRSRRRPIQSMSLNAHRVVGEFFQRLASHALPWRLGNKVGRQRALLEDWADIELRNHPGDDVSHDLYYGGPSREAFPSSGAIIEALAEVRALVEREYNDCKPRTELLAVLDELKLALVAGSVSLPK